MDENRSAFFSIQSKSDLSSKVIGGYRLGCDEVKQLVAEVVIAPPGRFVSVYHGDKSEFGMRHAGSGAPITETVINDFDPVILLQNLLKCECIYPKLQVPPRVICQIVDVGVCLYLSLASYLRKPPSL